MKKSGPLERDGKGHFYMGLPELLFAGKTEVFLSSATVGSLGRAFHTVSTLALSISQYASSIQKGLS